MHPCSNDEDAQSILIGVVLLAGIAITFLFLLQLNAVPAWNAAVEYEHSQKGAADALSLREAMMDAAASDTEASVDVSLGPTYPSRALFYNPPDPSGSIESRPLGPVVVTGSRALTPETADYWDGTQKTFSTKSVAFQTKYNEFQPSPIRWFEHTALFNLFPDTNASLSDQRIVSDRTLRLLLVEGDISLTATGSRSVAVGPGSAPWTSVAVTTTPAEPLEISLPTRLSEDNWRDLLDEELATNGGHVESIGFTAGDPNRLNITMEGGPSYDLRIASVGVGTNVSSPSEHYLTTDLNNRTVSESSSLEVVTEVRDRFNNPVPGVLVNYSLDGDGSLQATQDTSEDDGEATVTYVPDNVDGLGDTVTIRATISGDPSDPAFDARAKENVEFRTLVVNTDGSGQTDPDELNPTGTGQVEYISAERNPKTGTLSNEFINVTFENGHPQSVRPERIRIVAHSAASPGASGGTGLVGAAVENDIGKIPSDGNNATYTYLAPRGGYEDTTHLDSMSAFGGTQTYSMAFYNADGDRHKNQNDEFYILKVQWDNNQFSTYFISPE